MGQKHLLIIWLSFLGIFLRSDPSNYVIFLLFVATLIDLYDLFRWYKAGKVPKTEWLLCLYFGWFGFLLLKKIQVGGYWVNILSGLIFLGTFLFYRNAKVPLRPAFVLFMQLIAAFVGGFVFMISVYLLINFL